MNTHQFVVLVVLVAQMMRLFPFMQNTGEENKMYFVKYVGFRLCMVLAACFVVLLSWNNVFQHTNEGM